MKQGLQYEYAATPKRMLSTHRSRVAHPSTTRPQHSLLMLPPQGAPSCILPAHKAPLTAPNNPV